jgi:SAM-dependent methyltransferase
MRYSCPICDWHGERFLPKNGRDLARCPRCGSLERHRHQYLAFQSTGFACKGQSDRILHVAPELCISEFLRKLAPDYTSVDLRPGRAQIAADLTRLPFGADSFELIWVSHVLEHIRDAAGAITEVFRVLRPNGLAVIDVPIYGDSTVALNCPGDHGHVWAPGRDWYKAYSRAGLSVDLFAPERCAPEFGVARKGSVALCSKSLIAHE